MKTLAFATAFAATLFVMGATAPQDQKVEISDQGFMPQQVEIFTGQAVVWVNTSKHEHTVTSRAPADAQDDAQSKFDSGIIKPAMSWERKFNVPGTYTYGCTIDRTMTGVVIVRERR